MFERFTEQSRAVVATAVEYARESRHQRVEVADLVLALAAVGPSIAARVLESEYTRDGELRSRVLALPVELAAGEASPRAQVAFHPDTSKAMELALREALALGYNDIGPEHLLLGVARLGTVLLESERIRSGVFELLLERPSAKHLIAWSPAMSEACHTYHDVTRRAGDLLDRQGIPLQELSQVIDEVAAAAAAFGVALEQAVLPAVLP